METRDARYIYDDVLAEVIDCRALSSAPMSGSWTLGPSCMRRFGHSTTDECVRSAGITAVRGPASAGVSCCSVRRRRVVASRQRAWKALLLPQLE